MATPELVRTGRKNLVGICIQTFQRENKARELWQQFKPRVKEIQGIASPDFYSVQVFPAGIRFEAFTPETAYEKWAAVEVHDLALIPEGMASFVVPEGDYAVFIYKGLPAGFQEMARYIFQEWLPNSGFLLDARPHFEVMKPDYSPFDPEAEEEIWIPIRKQ